MRGFWGWMSGPILARYAKYIEKTMPTAQPEPQKEKNSQPRTEMAVFDWLGQQGSKIGWAVIAVAVVILLGIYVFQDSAEKPNPAKTIAREAVKPPEKPQETPPAEQPPVPPAQQPEAAPPQTTAQTSAPIPAATPQPAPVQTIAPEPRKPEAPIPAEQKPPTSTPVPGALSLKIEATEAAWVQVKADKTPAMQKLMQAGETLTTEAKEKITVDLGNAGGVQITFQGQSLGSPGKRGEVVRLVYPEGKRVEKKKPEEPKPAAQPAVRNKTDRKPPASRRSGVFQMQGDWNHVWIGNA